MTLPDGSLARRRVLITGAAGDIGSAVAVRAAREGARVVLADRPGTEPGLLTTASRCRVARSDVDVETVTFDVTDEQAVNDAFGNLAAAGLVPDALFNNAGYQGAFAHLVSYPVDDFRRVLEVNVVGAFAVLQAWAAVLVKDQRAGSAVNTASMAGVSGAVNMAAYSASKAAVVGLTKSAAKDLAPVAIRVNAVSPAFIGPGAMWDRQVALQASTPSEYYSDDAATVEEEMIRQIPMGRLGSLDEVASVVVFLLSEEASYLTGVNIEVAGGIG